MGEWKSWECMKYLEMLKENGRILMIFSTKSLIWTAATSFVGFIMYSLFKSVGFTKVGIGILLVFALIGFAIGTCKMPRIDSLKVSRQTEGENLDEIIKRAIKFKMKKNKIYVYAKEEKDNGIK